MDARAALDHAVVELGVPPEHLVLYGHSLGTGLAIELAAQLSDAGTPPGLLVLDAPYTSIRDRAAAQYPFVPVRWLLRHPFDSMARVPRVGSPTLVIHGTADTVVPYEDGETLASALGEAHGSDQVMFVTVHDGVHAPNGVFSRQGSRILFRTLDALRRDEAPW